MDQGYGQYDFIMSGNHKPKRSWLPTGNSKKQHAILIGLLCGALLFVAILFSWFLSSSGKASTQSMLEIAQRQHEIIRVADIARRESRSTATANLAGNTFLALTSDQQKSVSFLSKNGRKVNDKTLALLTDKTTDATLDSAKANGNFDDVFTKLLLDQIKSYQAAIQQRFDATKNTTEKELLKALYNDSVTLVKNQAA